MTIVFFKNTKTSQIQLTNLKILSKSLPMMLSGVMIFLLNWTDILMLGAMTSERNVGIYNAAFKIGFIVIIVIASFNVIIGPKITEFYSQGQKEALKNFVHKSTRLITFISIPLVILVLVFNKFLLLSLGRNYSEGSTVLIIITIAAFLNAASGNVDLILNFTNNQTALFKINIMVLVVNVFLNYFLISHYGIEGAAIASLVSTLLLNLACVFYIKKKLGFYTFN
jgi:O-antigen/teichoic acid export membrane protein